MLVFKLCKEYAFLLRKWQTCNVEFQPKENYIQVWYISMPLQRKAGS